MLGWLNYVFYVSNKTIDECYKKCGYIKYYFDKESRENNSKLIKYWNLIVSDAILSKGEEQYW